MLKKFAIVFCLVALSVPVAASAQSTLSVGQGVKTTANVNVRSKPANAKKNVLDNVFCRYDSRWPHRCNRLHLVERQF